MEMCHHITDQFTTFGPWYSFRDSVSLVINIKSWSNHRDWSLEINLLAICVFSPFLTHFSPLEDRIWQPLTNKVSYRKTERSNFLHRMVTTTKWLAYVFSRNCLGRFPFNDNLTCPEEMFSAVPADILWLTMCYCVYEQLQLDRRFCCWCHKRRDMFRFLRDA